MKRCIIILIAILLLLTGCQMVSEPKKESTVSAELETVHGLPPKSISLYSLDELNQIRGTIDSNDDSKMLDLLQQHSMVSYGDIEYFLKVVESIPVLKLFDGEIIYIGYQWPLPEGNGDNESLSTDRQNLGIAYITIQSKDGSWFRVNYWLKNRNMPIEEIMASSDRSISLLKTPIQGINGRCIVYHETRTPHSTDKGEIITWLAVVDDIPVMIKYYSENAEDIKAELVIKNATIGYIQ